MGSLITVMGAGTAVMMVFKSACGKSRPAQFCPEPKAALKNKVYFFFKLRVGVFHEPGQLPV